MLKRFLFTPILLFLDYGLVSSSNLSIICSGIAISFLSVELFQRSQAVGIIFGANIITTATEWIVSAAFGMPIILLRSEKFRRR